MPKNVCGFICNRYKQPVYYKELFGRYNAVYYTEKDAEIMIEAQVSPLIGNPIGREVEGYEILLQTDTCRRVLVSDIKSQKKAFEHLEKLIKKY